MAIEDAPSAERGVAWHDDEVGIEVCYRLRAFLVGIFRGMVFEHDNDFIECDDDDQLFATLHGSIEEVPVSVMEPVENTENHADIEMWSREIHACVLHRVIVP